MKLELDYRMGMATTLRDFIAQREAEIRDQQKALKAELRDLQAAKAAIDMPTVSRPATGVMGRTIKEMALEVLSNQPAGLTSSEILDAIRETFGRDIERTSLSPQLSRLKEEGLLTLIGDMWFTTANASERERQIFENAGAELEAFASQMPDDSEGAARTSRPLKDEWGEDLEGDVPF